MVATSTRTPPNQSGRPTRRRWGRLLLLAMLVGVMVFGSVVGASVAGSLRAPGTDSVAARLAEWGRDHGFDGLITWLEKQQYQRNQPRTGGVPVGGIPRFGSVSAAPSDPYAKTGPRRLPAPPPLHPPSGIAPLPGEGQWETVQTVHGQPAVRVTRVRPDREHTSFLAGVLWLDPTLVRGQLHPGFQDPGGSWQVGTSLTPAEQHTVVAAFNGGFRLNGASHGGYYSQGRTVRLLVDGAASLVLRTDGTATVGAWDREVQMGPDVASVRQNLVPLVDDGQVNPSCQSGGTAQWGSTVGQVAFIHRSAFGVTASGGEVYVGGPALSVCSLGQILQASGVVRGMELDINPNWVSGAYFHPTLQGPPEAFRLFPGEKVAAEHYLSPSSRDWYAFSARP
ncbi:MAG: phosphodiester glycosidase family protein [Pseudonocardiaceae bacterium]